MPVQWNHSIARDLLCNDVSNGLICKNTPVKVAHESRPEYLLCDQLVFEGYLDTIFETFDIKQSRAQRDAIAVAEFRNIHPKKPETHRGEPRWEGSEAESKLNQLVADGKHKGVKPSKLREDMGPTFDKFSKQTVRNHNYQAERAQKFKQYVNDKSDEKKDALSKFDD